jgi:ribonuclease J
LPSEQILILATGSQGEPMSVLNRLATGRHSTLSIQEEDTIVLSSHTIPGNEESVHAVINHLFQKGADVFYHPLAQVHVSGHASQEEQKLLINLLQPRYVVPIHGELRHLKQHAKLAQLVGVPRDNVLVAENGQELIYDGERFLANGRLPNEYVYVDGALVGEVGPTVMQQRDSLGQNGFVTVVVRYDPRSGRVIGDPRIITQGFVYLPEAEELLSRARDVIRSAGSVPPGTPPEQIERRVENRLARFFYRETRRNPVITSAALQ